MKRIRYSILLVRLTHNGLDFILQSSSLLYCCNLFLYHHLSSGRNSLKSAVKLQRFLTQQIRPASSFTRGWKHCYTTLAATLFLLPWSLTINIPMSVLTLCATSQLH